MLGGEWRVADQPRDPDAVAGFLGRVREADVGFLASQPCQLAIVQLQHLQVYNPEPPSVVPEPLELSPA